MEDDLQFDLFDTFDNVFGDLTDDIDFCSGQSVAIQAISNSGISPMSDIITANKFKPVKSNRITGKVQKHLSSHQRIRASKCRPKDKRAESPGEETPSELKLVIFPSFEKCDTLIYFPHALSRHLNTADFDSLSRLMHSYSAKDCLVRFSANDTGGCSYKNLLNIFTFSIDLHPDSVMCVHTANVVEHEISATMYFKYTDCRFINDSLKRTTTDQILAKMTQTRGNTLKQHLHQHVQSERERELYTALVDSDADIVVYGKLNLVLTVNSHSKKITHMLLDSQFTSVAPTVPIVYTI